MQRCTSRVSGLHSRFIVAELQSCRGAEVQRCRGAVVQRFIQEEPRYARRCKNYSNIARKSEKVRNNVRRCKKCKKM